MRSMAARQKQGRGCRQPPSEQIAPILARARTTMAPIDLKEPFRQVRDAIAEVHKDSGQPRWSGSMKTSGRTWRERVLETYVPVRRPPTSRRRFTRAFAVFRAPRMARALAEASDAGHPLLGEGPASRNARRSWLGETPTFTPPCLWRLLAPPFVLSRSARARCMLHARLARAQGWRSGTLLCPCSASRRRGGSASTSAVILYRPRHPAGTRRSCPARLSHRDRASRRVPY